MEIVTIETTSLGDRSYVLIDGPLAAVIDPQRDIDRVMEIINERGLRVTHVLETHLHNDYVTGGLELAHLTGAAYVLPAGDEVSFERTPAGDGDEFKLSDSVVLRAAHTPGHTPHHMSYVVIDRDEPVAAFTGGSMLYGTVGRTDLIGAEMTQELTRAQFHSVRRLAGELPEAAAVHPTHGFGSFCSSSQSSGSDSSTIGDERRTNIALTTEDEDSFVEKLLSGLTAYPRYYAHMAPRNRSGPADVDLSPPEVIDPDELRRRIADGEWVVDLRDRTAFARAHVAGTLNIELGDQFVTYLGWSIRWGTPVTLVGDTENEIAEAQRQLLRIGIDRPAGAATGGVEAWGSGAEIRSYRSATFADLAREQHPGIAVLDVRREDEWNEAHLAGAIHIPFYDLEDRVGELPPDRQIWIHCKSGFRASIAASIGDRAGLDVVAVHDDWEKASEQPDLSIVTKG